jgi:homoserine dehydrogenase
LTGEPGLFLGEVVGVRLSELVPGVVRLDEGGAGVEVLTGAVSSEDPLAGVLGAAEVLVVDRSSALKVLVAGPDGGLGPTTGACPKVDEVPLEGGLLLA